MARRQLSVGMPVARGITVLSVVDDDGPDAVYLVWNHRAWCPMACKVYDRPGDARREAAVLGALAHPNIVRGLGTGSPGYLLMEYLDGPTLKQLIQSRQEGRLSLANAMRVGIYLGSALIHMHSRGFLHLDVKPSNIVIYRGRPVLFDLGTARPCRQPQLKSSIGTDFYMSPEQCESGQVSPASDVFAFGVTLYQMLTGKLPFPETHSRTSFPQTRIDSMPLRSELPRAPKSLESLLQNCLARPAAARPALGQLLPALHEFINTGPRMWPASFEPTAPVPPLPRLKAVP
jgi:eukaryotic-like serine/threonine-protein kinase